MKLLKILLVIPILLLSVSSRAETILDAERAVGQVRLGMSEKDFYGLTGIVPEDCLGICEPEETYAEIDCQKIPKVCAPVSDVISIEALFWKKRIYYMMIGFKEISLENAKSHLTRKYGKPLKEGPQGTPALFIIKWSNERTATSIVYNAKKRKASTLYLKDLTQKTDGAQY